MIERRLLKTFFRGIGNSFEDLFEFFFPTVCLSCDALLSEGEKILCVKCRHELPVTNYHWEQPDFIKKRFHGRVQISQATALFRFEKKGRVQRLIHQLKYKGHEDLGRFFGLWLGAELKRIPAYQEIDMVVPVPLHRRRLRKRGYNQVALFSKVLASELGAIYEDAVLIKTRNIRSKTKRSAIGRWQKENPFLLQNAERIENKHLLLVDDTLTTGGTIEDCANQLLLANGVKISLVTIAITE